MNTKSAYIVWHDAKEHFLTAKTIGGKAMGLHNLTKLKMNVPEWGTLSTIFIDSIFDKHPSLVRLLDQQMDDDARSYIQNLTFDPSDEKHLKEIWERISLKGSRRIAVRSSAVDEDSNQLSFAGQMDSFLNISTYPEYLQAVKDCWASLFGKRAIAYRQQHQLNPWKAKIAVVTQRMVDADVSGVIFTANPITNQLNEMLISSVKGLGEALVSGQSDADTYVLDHLGDVKEEKPIFHSLSHEQLKSLHALAKRAKDKINTHLDIEFSIQGDTIFLLQARPITSLKMKDTHRIWDNSNIVESYSGVTTPLTFSFIRQAYYAVYWQFCETIGISQKQIFKNRHILNNMLGLIQGRVYYNLLNWYSLVSMMPGFQYNKRFMEQMMGLHVVKDDIESPKKGWNKYLIQLPRLLKVASKMVFAHLRLPKQIATFHKHFDRIYQKFSSIDYMKKSPSEILGCYRVLEEELLWKWRSPITNDFEAMIFYGLLKKLTIKWEIDPQGILQNDLLTGEGQIKSTQLIADLAYLAIAIEKNPSLKKIFLEKSCEEALDELKNNHDFHEIEKQFSQYLDKYGVRCIHEMKLESTPLKDDPLFCIATIQNYLRSSVPDPKEQEKREKNLRESAEKILNQKLKGPKKTLYKWILKNARKAIKNRENQRFARTQAYSLIRTQMQAIGKQWAEKEVINNHKDIFYLDFDEVWSYVEGTSTCTSLKELIEIRKAEFSKFRSETPDDRIETEGVVYYDNPFFHEMEETNEKALKGLGCCSGIVENTVKVVFTPDKDLRLNNEILVAKETDPGWGILFPSISGLIVEKGSMLSHSAIVAREMGIPAVIGVKNATKILSSGDRVKLDGTKGTVEKL